MLAELCELSPDVRFRQLFAHLGFLGEDQTGLSLWEIDDEQFLAVLYHHRSKLAARQTDSPNHPLQPTGAARVVSQASANSGASPAAEL